MKILNVFEKELLEPFRWKRLIRRKTVEAAKKDIAVFMRLESIDADTKRQLAPKARRCINRFHRLRYPSTVGQFIVAELLLIGLSLAIMIPLLNWIFASVNNKFQAGWFVAAGGVLYYFYIFILPSNSSLRYRLWAMAVYPATIILFAVATLHWQSNLLSGPWFARVVGFLAGGSLMSAFIVSMGIGMIPLLFMTARSLRRNTDSRLFIRMVAVLDKVERNRAGWDELPFRAELAGELEVIANMIQRDLPAQCIAGDEAFNVWIGERAWRAAAFMRDMKKWVTVPREDTRAFFAWQISRIVVCIAKSDWDGIPVTETSQQSKRARRLANAVGILRTLVASILPVAILGILNRYQISLPEAVKPYVYFGSVAWLVIGFISLLDPLYAARFETVKSALQLLPLVKKKE